MGRVLLAFADRAVKIVNHDFHRQSAQRLRFVVHHFDAEIRFVQLHVHGFRSFFRAVERRVGLQIVMIELPDETGLGRMAHPGDHACSVLKHSGIAPFVHRAKRFVGGELAFARKIGEVANVPVTHRERSRELVAALRARGHIVLGPVVVDRLPIFLRHHALNRFEGWHRH